MQHSVALRVLPAAPVGAMASFMSIMSFHPLTVRKWRARHSLAFMKAWKELKEGNTIITVMYSEKNPRRNVPCICADYEAVNDAE